MQSARRTSAPVWQRAAAGLLRDSRSAATSPSCCCTDLTAARWSGAGRCRGSHDTRRRTHSTFWGAQLGILLIVRAALQSKSALRFARTHETTTHQRFGRHATHQPQQQTHLAAKLYARGPALEHALAGPLRDTSLTLLAHVWWAHALLTTIWHLRHPRRPRAPRRPSSRRRRRRARRCAATPRCPRRLRYPRPR